MTLAGFLDDAVLISVIENRVLAAILQPLFTCVITVICPSNHMVQSKFNWPCTTLCNLLCLMNIVITEHAAVCA